MDCVFILNVFVFNKNQISMISYEKTSFNRQHSIYIVQKMYIHLVYKKSIQLIIKL